MTATKYSRTFKCKRCGLVHVVESDRNDLDAKEILRIQQCKGDKNDK